MKINRLVLGSTSPYRAKLLASSGVEFDVLSSPADEGQISSSQSPLELAQKRSDFKGQGFFPFSDSVLVIAADQVLEFKGEAYGKVASEVDAIARLKLFSGHEHQLHSAYSIYYYQAAKPGQRLAQGVVSAELKMRQLKREEISAYVATGEWKGCAGCYQLENRGIHLFDDVKGDSSTIIGLPLVALMRDLRKIGLDPLIQTHGPWII